MAQQPEGGDDQKSTPWHAQDEQQHGGCAAAPPMHINTTTEVVTCLCLWIACDANALHSLSARVRLLGALRCVDRASRDAVCEIALPLLTERQVPAATRSWFAALRPPTPTSLVYKSDRRVFRLDRELCTRPSRVTTPAALVLDLKPRRTAVTRLLALSERPALWQLIPLKTELRDRRSRAISSADARRQLRLTPQHLAGLRGPPYVHEDCLDVAREVHGDWGTLQRRIETAVERSTKAANGRRVSASRRAELCDLYASQVMAHATAPSSAGSDGNAAGPTTGASLLLAAQAVRRCCGFEDIVSCDVEANAAVRRYKRSGRAAHREAAVVALRAALRGPTERARWVEDAFADPRGALPVPCGGAEDTRRELTAPWLLTAVDEFVLFAGEDDRAIVQRASEAWRWACQLWAGWERDLATHAEGAGQEGQAQEGLGQGRAQTAVLGRALSPLVSPVVLQSLRGVLEASRATRNLVSDADAGADAEPPAHTHAKEVRRWWRTAAGTFQRHNASLPTPPRAEDPPHWSFVDAELFSHTMALQQTRMPDGAEAQASHALQMVAQAVRDLRNRAFELALLRLPSAVRNSAARRELRAMVGNVLAKADASHAYSPMSRVVQIAVELVSRPPSSRGRHASDRTVVL